MKSGPKDMNLSQLHYIYEIKYEDLAGVGCDFLQGDSII